MAASGGLAPRPRTGRSLVPGAPLGLAAVILLAAASTRAASPRVARLSYLLGPGTKSCPEEQAFRASVRAQADRDLFPAEAAAHLRVAVSQRPKDGRYEAVIDLHDEGGLLFHQEIDPRRRCSDVVETAVALSVTQVMQTTLPRTSPIDR